MRGGGSNQRGSSAATRSSNQAILGAAPRHMAPGIIMPGAKPQVHRKSIFLWRFAKIAKEMTTEIGFEVEIGFQIGIEIEIR